MDSREEFEAWAADFWGVEVEYVRDPDRWSGQDAIILGSAWPAWQASRAAVVVVLPALRPAESYANHHCFGPEDLAAAYKSSSLDCHSAIEAAGVKVAV